MKRKMTLLMAVSVALLFIGCASQKEEAPPRNSTPAYTDFIDADKVIAVQSGEIFNLVARNLFKAKKVPEYANMPDLLEALRMGRVDAVMTDGSYVKQLKDSGIFPEFDYLWIEKDFFANKSAPVFHTAELRDKYDEWLAGIKADGTHDKIVNRWIGVSLPAQEDIPKFGLTGKNGTLRVCDTGNYPPFSYYDAQGKLAGFDYELISRFAQHMGMDLDVTMMSYDAIIPYVISGKADMSACLFTITEERGQSTIFGAPTIVTPTVLIVPKSTAETNKKVPDYTDFAGKDIAVITGVLTYITAEKIGGRPVNYSDSSSAAEDVRQGRVAGYMHALSAVQVMAARLDGFDAITVPKEIFSAQIGGISHDQAVIDRFNAFLSAIEADGTLAAMGNRWLGDSLDLDAPLPNIQNSGKNGVLKVAVCSDSIPYVYVGANREFSGFSVELALRFGAYEGKTVKFTDMEFGGLIPYIVSKKADFAIANMAITEERKKSVLFTDPFFDEQHGLLVLKGSREAAKNSVSVPDYTWFAGKRIGTKTGTVLDKTIENNIKGTPAFYSEMSAGIEDVRKGRIEGYITDLSAARLFVATEKDGDLICVEVPSGIFSAPMGAISLNQDIINRFNVFLAGIKADGTLKSMQDRWLNAVAGLDPSMPDIPLTGKKGKLRVATSAGAVPFSYMGANKEFKGYSIELIRRFAAYEGLSITFAEMEFGGLIPYIAGGKADLAIADISITEERKKSVLFTDSFYEDQAAIIALKKPSPAPDSAARNYTDFIGKKFAVKNGTIYDPMATDVMKASEKLLFEDYPSIYEAVQKGKADAAMRNYYASRVSILDSAYADLDIITLDSKHSLYIAAISMDQSLIDTFNEFLVVIKGDGTYDEMKTRWFDKFDPQNIPSMPEIPLTDKNGTLVIAISSDYMPYSFLGDNGVNLGFDIEMARRFAAYVKKDVKFADMAFSGLLPYVMSGKADIAISDITITEERKKSVLFTEPYIIDRSAIIFKGDSGVTEQVAGGGFITWLNTGIERNLITDKRWKMVAGGLGVTMLIAMAAQLLGTVLGFFVCWLLTRKSKIVRWIGNLYCGLIYGTPIVVLLMITYYIIFGSTNISNVLVAIVAFTMVMGAIIAQNLKGAIETVDPVEIEAARSIGFSALKAFLTVTFPQAVRRALPGYTNSFVELVKATAIVGYIAIQDLTRAADIIRSRTYDAYFPLLLVAIIYLLVTATCVWLFKIIVNKANGGVSQ